MVLRKAQRLIAVRRVAKLIFLSFGNIGVSFLYQWYVLTRVGPGIETDALFAGMTVPQIILSVTAGSLMHVFVPLLSGENKSQIKKDAWCFTILVALVFGTLSIVLYCLATLWVPITVPGFSESAQNLTVEITQIQLLGLVFSAINSVQYAACHARMNFTRTEWVPLTVNLFSFVLLVIYLPLYGIFAAAWISVLRVFVQTLLLLPEMGIPVWGGVNPIVKIAWSRMRPLLYGAAYYKTDPIVDRLLLSYASNGSLSLYYLAQQLYAAAHQVFNSAFSAPIVPVLSENYKKGEEINFMRIYASKLIQLSLIGGLSLVILFIFGDSILRIVIGYGNIDPSNVYELWLILIWLSGSFFGGLVGQLSASAFYACGNTHTPTKISFITHTLYLPLKVAGFFQWGVAGLAIATSVCTFINCLTQVILMLRGGIHGNSGRVNV